MTEESIHNVVAMKKDMGLSHQEFFASLTTLAREIPCQVTDKGVVVAYDSGEIRIGLGPESERQLGSINLARTWVSLEFHNLSDEQQNRFLERFDLAFHRGGG